MDIPERIKITKLIPVQEHVRPKEGNIYDVIRAEKKEGQAIGRRRIYFIKVNGTEVGVFPEECEEVKT